MANEALDSRGETQEQRADRNWGEILQELRVSQTGTQIISGFLLAVAFQPRFTQLDGFEYVVYGVLVALATISTALGVAAVALHRGTFRLHEKPIAVEFGSRLLVVAVATVGLLSVGVILFLFDVAFGRLAGIVGGIAAAVLVGCLVIVLPHRARVLGRRRVHQGD